MPVPLAKKFLLLGWDAADWQMIHPLIDAGRMPHLKSLVEGGVIGNLLTLQPILSPILWTSIITGKRAYQHGVHGFAEASPDGMSLRPTSSETRKCKALWNILAHSGQRCQAIGWYASHPAEKINGVCISHQFPVAPSSATATHWPPQPNSVEPVELAQELAELRLHPSEVTGTMLAQFLPRAAELDQSDPEVRRLLSALARRLAECASLHAVTTAVMETEPWDFCTAYYEAIDHVGHDFMAFHPPRMAHVRPDLFEHFSGVMNTIYDFHDQMLGRLLELAGPETHVMLVSDHGFLSGERRPTREVDPAQWHRNFGVFVLAGPGIKRDTILHGGTLLDIAPTILTLFGLPVGRDMEGKVLMNAFEEIPAVERIDSWEAVPDPAAPAPAAARQDDDPEAAAAALRQLVELGYLEAPGEDLQRDIARAQAEQKFNLACTYIDGQKPAEALRLTTELAAQFPDMPRYAVLRGQAAISSGDADALGDVILGLEKSPHEIRQLWLFRAFHSLLRGELEESILRFREAEKLGPRDPWLFCRIGRVFLRLRQWPEGEEAFRKALEVDPDNAEAYYGLSVALPRQGRLEEGVQCGLQAISLQQDFPLAHFQLAAVLSRLGWYERALQAFEICLAMRPNFALAHRYVSMISNRLGRTEAAQRHRDLGKQILSEGWPQPTVD